VSKRLVKPGSADPKPQSKDASAIAATPEDQPRRGLPLSGKEIFAVIFVTVLASVVRAILLPAPGHTTDIATFESWMNTLIKFGPSGFYSNASFVDYPPGYMLVLWITGLAYHAMFAYGDLSGDIIRVFVKLPAIIADLAIGYLVFLIARRYWSVAAAIVAMAVFVLNPVSWLVSAYWGQADSVAAVFLVWAIYLALTDRFEFAWIVLAFAVLVKPQPLAVAPMLLVWQIRRQGPSWRLVLVPLLSLIVAYAGSVWFAPDANPAHVMAWLYDRYHTGVGVYPYNSVNALNLYSINRDFFEPDTQPISLFGLDLGPQYAWGIAIFIALAAALAWRLWRVVGTAADDDTREVALITASFIVMLGFFMVLTRQHERYLFSALAIAPLLWNATPVMRLATVLLSGTFIYNLYYALQYLNAPSPDLNPYLVHPLSLLNFAVLVLVAGAFLIDEVGEWANARLGAIRSPEAAPAGKRAGPNPFEGLVSFQPRDYLIAGLMTLGTGVLLFWNITKPGYRIFDEIYYARAAQEYLAHHSLYEWTHPPLTKLIMAAGAWFFGRLGYGDPFGARMANALMGTLTVPLIYAFAKRLFGSTLASVVAVILLVSSGWFYVQARIATPEISVAFFSLLALYCFYRFISASQIVQSTAKPQYPDFASAVAALAVVVVLVVLIAAEVSEYNAQMWSVVVVPYIVAVVVFGAAVAYWALSWRTRRAGAKFAVYPDGSYVDGNTIFLPWGDSRTLKSPPLADSSATVSYRADSVEVRSGTDTVVWHADGSIDGVVEGQQVRDRQLWGLWLALAAVCIAAFVSSKWNGLFGFAALWITATAISVQQLMPWITGKKGSDRTARRFVWGNPLGTRLPLFFAATILGVLIVYVLTYVPNWSGAIATGVSTLGQPGWAGLLSLQYQMYHYHATLNATHLYSSKWWTWPLELRPVSYDYKVISGVTPPNQTVEEIVDLANPFMWWGGVITVPWAAVAAWRERHRGIMLLIVAYIVQWVPWAASPRIDFNYNFYPNLALICLCTTYVLLTIVRAVKAREQRWIPMAWAAGYLALCIWGFLYFLPIWNDRTITWTQWIGRMWIQGPIVHGWI
jgi:Gpi18-like mannosyltransferase